MLHTVSRPNDDGYRLRVAERLREYRAKSAHTQQSLADAVGVHYRTIQGLEAAKHTPKRDTLLRVASALGVRLEDLEGATATAPREYVDRFLLSDYARDIAVTPDEIAWLRSLPEIAWSGDGEPGNHALYHLVLAYRSKR